MPVRSSKTSPGASWLSEAGDPWLAESMSPHHEELSYPVSIGACRRLPSLEDYDQSPSRFGVDLVESLDRGF